MSFFTSSKHLKVDAEKRWKFMASLSQWKEMRFSYRLLFKDDEFLHPYATMLSFYENILRFSEGLNKFPLLYFT